MITIKKSDYEKIVAFIRDTNTLRTSSKKTFAKIFAFLYYSGCRINEALKIKVEDIKMAITFKEVKIYTSKSNKIRTIYFSDDAAKEFEILFEHELKFKTDNDLVFDYSIKSMTDRLNSVIRDSLGILSGGTHGFRRGIITEMIIDKGVNARVVQEFIGHANVATTLTYYKPSKDDIKSALIR